MYDDFVPRGWIRDQSALLGKGILETDHVDRWDGVAWVRVPTCELRGGDWVRVRCAGDVRMRDHGVGLVAIEVV